MEIKCALGSLLCSAACSTENFIPRSSLTDEEAELIRWRSGLKRFDQLCLKHCRKYLILFPLSNKKCCDPFVRYKKRVTKCLKEVDLEFIRSFSGVLPFSLIPGQKLCVNCWRGVKEFLTGQSAVTRSEKLIIQSLFCARTEENNF